MKRTLILLSILLIALLAFGCGKKPAVESPTKPTTSNTPDKQVPPNPDNPPPGDVVTAMDFVTIYFDFDKSNIRDDARNGLKNNFDMLKSNPDMRVLIEGHCDERGTVEYNLALGERRARAAMEYLANLGISRDRMSIISYGKERPAVLGSNEDAWAKNRRDEFVAK